MDLDDGGGLLYRLSLKTCLGSREPAGVSRTSILVGTMMLKRATGAIHRATSPQRCCRVGSGERRSTDFEVWECAIVGTQNRVVTLNVNENMATAISTLRLIRSPLTGCRSNCIKSTVLLLLGLSIPHPTENRPRLYVKFDTKVWGLVA